MEKKIYINKNDSSATGLLFTIQPNMSFIEFKKYAGDKLGYKKCPKRVFLSTGAEISKLEDISAKASVYLSLGEEFFRSSTAVTDKISISILGNGDVGKSAIVLRFIRDAFIQNWEATIEDVYRKTVRLDSDVYMLEILDTAGQEDFSTLRAQWMANKDGFIFVYSVADKESLATIYDLIDLLPQVCVNIPIPPILIVGNKLDLCSNNNNNNSDNGSVENTSFVSLEDAEKLIIACKNKVMQLQANWIERQIRKYKSSGSSNKSSKNSKSNNNDEEDNSARVITNPTIFVEHMQVSALTGLRIHELFHIMIRNIKLSELNNQNIITNNKNKYGGGSNKSGRDENKKKSSGWCWFL